MIGREFPENAPMVLYKLRKEYPSPSGGPPYVAVHSVSVAIEKNECFGLLGPNGRSVMYTHVLHTCLEKICLISSCM